MGEESVVRVKVAVVGVGEEGVGEEGVCEKGVEEVVVGVEELAFHPVGRRLRKNCCLYFVRNLCVHEDEYVVLYVAEMRM